jgi:hypothetical protein
MPSTVSRGSADLLRLPRCSASRRGTEDPPGRPRAPLFSADRPGYVRITVGTLSTLYRITVIPADYGAGFDLTKVEASCGAAYSARRAAAG